MSVAPEYIPRIYLFFNVVEAGVVAVGDDGLALPLEVVEAVDNFAAEERGAVGEGWFVNDYFRALGLDALHHALD